MSIQYSWVVERLDCYPALETFENVVCMVYWRLNAAAEEDGKHATVYGSLAVDLSKSPTKEPFTPYDQLTEAQVVRWLEAGLNVEELKAVLEGNILAQRDPPVVSPALPWE